MTGEPEPEPGPDKGLDARVSTLESGQESLSDRVDEILGIVKGKHDGDPTGPPAAADPPPQQQITPEMMADVIRKVNAETPPPAPAKPTPEKPPREAGQPKRNRLAEVLYGKEAKPK
jgi:hypothetical protein